MSLSVSLILNASLLQMMFSGYDMNPDGTASAFTADGFYKMGDVVQITWPEDAPAQDASVPHSGVVRTPDLPRVSSR